MSTDTREWLERLYASSPGYFSITPFLKGKGTPESSSWLSTSQSDLDKAARAIERAKDKANLYLSIGTHESPQRTRGGESTVVSIPGLWADLDIGELGHKPASLPNPPDEETALSIVEGLPEPSMLMHSGGGLQAIWLFQSPWVFDSNADRTEAKRVVQEWGNLLEEKGRLLEFHVDKVADLARILRVPGSLNHKENQVRPVAIRWVDKPAHDREELAGFGIPDSEQYNVDPEEQKIHDDFPLSWNEILAPHGYAQCSDSTWARPGKKCSEGISLSVPDFASYVITNFSESDPLLPVGRGTKITKRKLYALLNHNGDEKKAKTELDKMVRKIRPVRADSYKPKPVRWLWDGRVAVGTLALLAGREGIGKSTLAYTLVADITKGNLDGQFKGKPRSVIIVATEDSWEFTIVPRLMAAGADLTKVFNIEPTDPDEFGIRLPRDVHELADIAKELDTALILLDPLMSRVDNKLDTHKDSEVRQALEPLVRMGIESDASIMGLIHVNKSGATDPLSTLMGSRAFSAVARAVLYVVEDANDTSIKIMGQPKNNLGRSDLPDKTYTLKQVTVGEFDGETITSVQLNWQNDRAPNEHREHVNAKPKSKKDQAESWLEGFLDGEEKVPVNTIKENGELLGFDYKTLQRALKALGGESFREGGPGNGTYYWKLAADFPWELS